MARGKGIEGTSGLRKDQLVEIVAKDLGIDKPHLVVEGNDKLAIKSRIRRLKTEVATAVEAHDKETAHRKRRQIHRLKRRIHKAAQLTH
jgi:protein-arginine kinase activator protein McsA